MSITITPRWSLGRGKTVVPSSWQATVENDHSHDARSQVPLACSAATQGPLEAGVWFELRVRAQHPELLGGPNQHRRHLPRPRTDAMGRGSGLTAHRPARPRRPSSRGPSAPDRCRLCLRPEGLPGNRRPARHLLLGARFGRHT